MQELGVEFVSEPVQARRILAGLCTRYRWQRLLCASGRGPRLEILGAQPRTLIESEALRSGCGKTNLSRQ